LDLPTAPPDMEKASHPRFSQQNQQAPLLEELPEVATA
jgi:hypothetical protein